MENTFWKQDDKHPAQKFTFMKCSVNMCWIKLIQYQWAGRSSTGLKGEGAKGALVGSICQFLWLKNTSAIVDFKLPTGCHWTWSWKDVLTHSSYGPYQQAPVLYCDQGTKEMVKNCVSACLVTGYTLATPDDVGTRDMFHLPLFCTRMSTAVWIM